MHLFLKKIYRKNPFPKIYRINQCEVLINWNPKYKERGYTLGPATVTITKDGSSFTVSNEYFGLKSNQLDDKYDEDDKIKTLITKSLASTTMNSIYLTVNWVIPTRLSFSLI